MADGKRCGNVETVSEQKETKEEEETFVCEECGAEFASAQALNGHMI